ncbi:MAG: superinfection immunity protein [Gammaproteobacteria bacterium]|nr:superinfection immunity protein [Gammaproteobacteria bacterium]MDE0251317.1 superinfection immunity protein [Gammaproteobacteria bacterium]MDE0401999.1 superinfection immunity protein [Gammaproteobacteria bacterium]
MKQDENMKPINERYQICLLIGLSIFYVCLGMTTGDWWTAGSLSLLLFLYLLPTTLAVSLDCKGKGLIIFVNVFFGWTAIGWCTAAVMVWLRKPKPEDSKFRDCIELPPILDGK